MEIPWLDWLGRLTIDFDYQPLTWSICAVVFICAGIARRQWLAAFVFGFSFIYAGGWLLWWIATFPDIVVNDPFLQRGYISATLPPFLFFWACALISADALWRAVPMRAPLPVFAALFLAHLFNLFLIALIVA